MSEVYNNLGPDEQAEFNSQLFGVRRSSRYHEARMRHFKWWDDRLKFISLLSGTSVVATLIAKLDPNISLAVAVFFVVLQLIDVIASPSKKASRHSDWSVRFDNLEQQFIAFKEGRLESSVGKLVEARIEIEKEEPSVKKWLNIISHNEQCVAMGLKDDELYEVPWWQRALAQFVDIKPVDGVKRRTVNP